MDALPSTIANCRILGKLGQGGMGTVYRAIHMALGRYMAIKVLPVEFTQDPQYLTRFMREARAIASFTHPNIVVVHDAGEQLGHYYIAMELIDGASLSAILKHCNRIPERIALRYLDQAANGLGYAHDRGLVHRDIKPENLLINREGTLKVVDFGLVMESSSQTHLTRPGAVLGTPTFMSPEQCEGDVADARSDLYSLGATFYRTLTGRAPFHSQTMLGVMYKHRFEAPHPLDPFISEPTRAIILKLMAKNRDERHASAKALSEDIAKALAALPPDEQPWSLDEVLTAVAPPLPTPPPELLSALSKRPDVNARSVTAPTVSIPAQAGAEGPASPPTPSSSTPGVFDPTVVLGRPFTPPSSPDVPVAHDNATPLPPTTARTAAARGRKRIWAAVATLALVALGWAGWDYYRSTRQTSVERYISMVDQFSAEGNLDDASAQLFLALATYPEEPRLLKLRQELADKRKKIHDRELTEERQSVRKEVRFENLVASADKAVVDAQYDEALKIYDEAMALGVESDELAMRIRGVRFTRLKALANQAETARRWEDGLALAQQAQEFGDAEELVQRFKQRLKVESLRADAQNLLQQKEYLAAADKYEAAAGLAVLDGDLKKELTEAALEQRLAYRLDRADQAEKRGEFYGAIAELNAALALDPNREATRKRLEQTRATLDRESNFDSAMDLGRKALDGKRWAEAAEMFRTALRHKQDSTDARDRLAEAEGRSLVDRARELAQRKSWRLAQALLAELKPVPSGLETDVERLGGEIQSNLDRIAAQETQAAKAARDGALDKAIGQYLALEELNPNSRATYDAALTSLRIEQAFRERLKEGDVAAQAGEWPKARTSYRQALEKKNDEVAQTTVQVRLDGVLALEKLPQIEALIQARHWDEARAGLDALPKVLPEGELKVSESVAARRKEVDTALSRIAALEETAKASVKDQKWDEGRAALKALTELNPLRAEAYGQQLTALEESRKAQLAKNAESAKEKISEARTIENVQELMDKMPEGATAADLIRQAQEKAKAKAESEKK